MEELSPANLGRCENCHSRPVAFIVTAKRGQPYVDELTPRTGDRQGVRFFCETCAAPIPPIERKRIV